MRHRFVAQQAIGIFDQEPRRIEHYQHFGGQSLGHRLAGLARDGLGDIRFLFVQPALKLAQHRDPLSHANLSPAPAPIAPALRRVNLTFVRAFQLAQNFTRRRIHRRNFARRDLLIGNHALAVQT
jgi:hypothetical protein